MLLLAVFTCIMYAAQAQSPNGITYQAIARNSGGNLLQNTTVALRFSIHSGTASGAIVYQETQSATTNNLGLFLVNIGQGTPVTGAFNSIDWGGAAKFTEVEIDPAGGTSYTSIGTTQMLSVPYALHATKADTAANVKITPGAASGNLLQSDANGNASWATPSSLSIGGWNVDANGDMFNTNTGDIYLNHNLNASNISATAVTAENLTINKGLRYTFVDVDLTFDYTINSPLVSGSRIVYSITTNGGGTIHFPASGVGVGQVFIFVNRTANPCAIDAYRNFFNTTSTSIPANSGVQIMREGSFWVQIL